MVDLLTRITFVLACVALVAIVGVTLVEIIMRYFFGRPTIWVSDAVRYLLACVILLGLPRLTMLQGHVSIDLLPQMQPVTSVYRRALTFVGAMTCFFVCWLVQDVFFKQIASNILTSGFWQIPRSWITGTLFTGFFLAGLAYLALTISPRPKD